MEMTRKWAMPNSETFSIKPIHDLLVEECGGSEQNNFIIDPFARNNHEFATITNDFNPECNSDYHMDGLDFMKNVPDNSVDIVLYDPPYSPRQVSEVYNHVGVEVTQETTSAAWRRNIWMKLLVLCEWVVNVFHLVGIAMVLVRNGALKLNVYYWFRMVVAIMTL